MKITHKKLPDIQKISKIKFNRFVFNYFNDDLLLLIIKLIIYKQKIFTAIKL